MKKIISFSLWGDDPKYIEGAFRNIELCKKIYPDWVLRFYLHKGLDKKILDKFLTIQHFHPKYLEVIFVDIEANWTSMFWRLFPHRDEDVECFICRDCDSRLNEREASAVQEWMESDKSVHIMRDHPHHGYAMLGGMIGFKKSFFGKIKEAMSLFNPEDKYGTDYVFFHNFLYPLANDDILTHDEFFDKKPFPTKREKDQFVGQVFDEHENTPQEHIDALNSA